MLPYHCRYGQSVCLIGSIDKLGKWDVSRAVEMSWHDGDLWKVELELPKRWEGVTGQGSLWWIRKQPPPGPARLGSAALPRHTALRLPPVPRFNNPRPRHPLRSGPDTTEEVEYKYVVRNSDRSAAHWAPGANYVLTLPPVGPVAQPGTVRLYVRDSWDGQEHKVKVGGWVGGLL